MHDPTTDAKTVPMNLVVMPNSAGEHPTYEWQPRDGVYFSTTLLTIFALMLFLGGAVVGLLGLAAVKVNAPTLVEDLCNPRAVDCR